MEAAGRRDGAVPDDNDSHGVYDDEDTAEGGGGPGCGLSLQVQRRDLGGGRVGLSYGPPGAQRHRSWLIVSDCFPPEVDRWVVYGSWRLLGCSRACVLTVFCQGAGA